MKMNYLLTFSYDGSKFFGSNPQKDKKTISGELEKVLTTIFKNFKLKFFSRTDRYVHALKQKAFLKTEYAIDTSLLKYILNSKIDKYIQILDVCNIENLLFKDIESREYVYKLKKELTPFEIDYFSEIKNVNIHNLEENFKLFKGEIDFSFLYYNNLKISNYDNYQIGKKKIFYKKIFYIKLKIISDNELHIYIKGSGFLKRMIRRIISLCISLDTKEKRGILKRCILSGEKIYNFVSIRNISPSGLYLKDIFIDENLLTSY